MMIFRRSFGVLAAAAMAVSSCETAGTIAGGGAGSDYSVARQALETGNYNLAIRRYEGLITRASQAPARLQLEYAHTLLRADRFSDAIEASQVLINHPENSIRGSALAVRGTARHELARQLSTQRPQDVQIRHLYEGARDDLALFLSEHSSFDSGGSMRARNSLILSDLEQSS